jgi:hypothetical protein
MRALRKTIRKETSVQTKSGSDHKSTTYVYINSANEQIMINKAK